VSERKLVSVVTGTYNRHELLLEAIENVRQQTYRPLEHVIVADGPDEDLDAILLEDYIENLNTPEPWRVDIRSYSLGFWSSGLLTDSISAAPFMVAQLLARGDYQMWLADDERMLVPDHIEQLVDLIEQYDADFAYPKVEMTWPDSDRKVVIGHNPPRNGDVTHMLYRRDALDKGALFRTHVGSGTDWDAFARLMASGCRWVFNPKVTFTHQVDKILVGALTAGLFMQGWV
jgi:glycosyltransferase involved in cell wall biosynthesis